MDERLPGILRAIRTLKAHEAVESVRLETDGPDYVVTADFRVSMASRWQAEGASPTGVRPVEPVTLRFSRDFPLRPPKVTLRPDFNRAHPHINPGDPAAPPSPCLVEGSLAEFMLVEGFVGVVNQISVWLDNAAAGTLIDPHQGWEPVRRDNVPHRMSADARMLRAGADGIERPLFFPCRYYRLQAGHNEYIEATLSNERVSADAKTIGKLFKSSTVEQGVTIGTALALVACPGKLPGGALKQANGYLQETVATLDDLRARADDYGCLRALDTGLDLLRRRFAEASAKQEYGLVLPVVLLAARPHNLIGSDSRIELVPYVISCPMGAFLSPDESLRIAPASQLDTLTQELLRRTSGLPQRAAPTPWALVGAGSLGSHIGIAMGRMGDAPAQVVDNDFFSPHNAARYALVATDGEWTALGNKAYAMARALGALAQPCRALADDMIELLRDPERCRRTFPPSTWAIVNTTGSLAVRDALVAAGPQIDARVIEGGLYGTGALGTLVIEGDHHNPSVADLTAQMYELARGDMDLHAALFPELPAHSNVEIGQGCRSRTMTLPDALVTLFASSMALRLSDLRQTGFPENGGLLLLGMRDGIQVHWTETTVEPCLVVAVESGSWQIRLSRQVDREIASEIAAHPGVETGGILMGRICEAARTFHVTGLIPAPIDSIRSASRFDLGTKDVGRTIENYAGSAGGALHSLGTWHNHLYASGPSATDLQTARVIGRARIAPSVLLIHTPSGYRALLAEDEGS